MKPSALEYLVCIGCGSQLELNVEQKEDSRAGEAFEVLSGTLSCKKCRRAYPIVRGIPRFVDQALSSQTDLLTGHRFEIAWKEFPRFDERYRLQFFDWLAPVGPEFLKGKVVLEAGCGKGRHAKIVAEAGARVVFGVDIGEQVEIAYKVAGHLPGVHIVQADISHMPFGKSFDFAFSVGVLHHMDAPHEGFEALVRCLKGDGSVSVWVYGQENNWWLIHLLNPIRIGITSKMPPGLLRFISMVLAAIVYLVSKLIARPWVNLRRALPFLPDLFYQDYLAYIARFDFNEIHHITFDHLVTPVAYYLPRTEVERWYAKANFPNPTIRWHNRNSWAGFGSYRQADQESMRKKAESMATTG